MPPKQPARTTDRRRGPKAPPPIAQPKSGIEKADEAYEDAAKNGFTPLFNDRRGSR